MHACSCKMAQRLKLKSPRFLQRMKTNADTFLFICLAVICSLITKTCARMPVANKPSMPSGHPYQMQLEHGRRRKSSCEWITVGMCSDIGYNKTDVSLSPAGIDVQSEADNQVQYIIIPRYQ